jgi:sigma-54 dependent transcriptional regulator, acetoin dehydrogenase operon transcriptional activator AcoR
MQVLVVEDSPTQAAELEAVLKNAGFDVQRADRLQDAVEYLSAHGVEIVLLDLGLPDGSGLPVVKRVRDAAADVPIVVLTGLEDEETALRAVQEGAQDYLFKGRVDGDLVVRAVRYALERKRAERALRESYQDLISILNRLRTGTIMTDPLGQLTFVSKACEPFIEGPGPEVLGRHWQEVLPLQAEDSARVLDMTKRPAELREKLATHMETPTGRRYWVDIEIHDDPRDPDRKIFCLYDVSEVRDLRRLLDEKSRFQDLVGRSPRMLAVYDLIRQVARVETTVLIEGETGTGKELVACAIHALSPRGGKPFVAVNSAGLTDSLLASQLFGHKRGAFTGAIEDHKGFFETASGGTLFLDEISDIPANVQSSLLRVLQEHEIMRVGDSKPRQVDVRVVVATNRNLSQAVAAGAFRSDLFYRIRVAHIVLPPLRERREDIPLLVEAFLAQFRATTGKAVEGVSEAALGLLMEFPWPGNVRELQGVIEFAVIRCPGPLIDVDDLPPEIVGAGSAGPARRPVQISRAAHASVRSEEERKRVLGALEQANGNRSVAAQLLGIGRATFYRRLEALGIDLDRDS